MKPFVFQSFYPSLLLFGQCYAFDSVDWVLECTVHVTLHQFDIVHSSMVVYYAGLPCTFSLLLCMHYQACMHENVGLSLCRPSPSSFSFALGGSEVECKTDEAE